MRPLLLLLFLLPSTLYSRDSSVLQLKLRREMAIYGCSGIAAGSSLLIGRSLTGLTTSQLGALNPYNVPSFDRWSIGPIFEQAHAQRAQDGCARGFFPTHRHALELRGKAFVPNKFALSII